MGYSEVKKRYTFEAGDTTWTVELEELESYDSEEAPSALKVISDTGEAGYIQAAWVGENPGDLGPLWLIVSDSDEVMGACWSTYDYPGTECSTTAADPFRGYSGCWSFPEDPELECIELYVPFTTDDPSFPEVGKTWAWQEY